MRLFLTPTASLVEHQSHAHLLHTGQPLPAEGPTMPRVPTVSYGDSYTVGQLAHQWQKPIAFVRCMIE
jgi:hypothetical protein